MPMSFLKKVKDYIFGEDLVDDHSYQPSSSGFEAGPGGWVPPDVRAKAAAARAAAAAAARERAREVPILQDAHPEVGGGIQGLSWYKSRMQQDADGDVAHQFLSEQQPAQAAPAEPKRPRTGRERPLPPLQTQRARLQRTGAAEMIVDQGNVYVVPVT